MVAVLSVTEKDIQDAFGQKWKDFEDCVQYMTGKNNKADCAPRRQLTEQSTQ